MLISFFNQRSESFIVLVFLLRRLAISIITKWITLLLLLLNTSLNLFAICREIFFDLIQSIFTVDIVIISKDQIKFYTSVD